jgi:GntR family transcriptional regulator
MRVHIAPNSGVPIYLQIINQMKYLVASGRLAPGDELPPIRTLAEQLLVNPNTVARAYRELETAGIVTSRVGAGTYLTDQVSPLARRERLRILTEDVDALLAQASQLGFEIEEVVNVLRRREAEMRGGTKEGKQHG